MRVPQVLMVVGVLALTVSVGSFGCNGAVEDTEFAPEPRDMPAPEQPLQPQRPADPGAGDMGQQERQQPADPW